MCVYLLWLEPVGLLSLGEVLVLPRPHLLLLHTHAIPSTNHISHHWFEPRWPDGPITSSTSPSPHNILSRKERKNTVSSLPISPSMYVHISQETYELVEVSGDGGRGGVACVGAEVGLHEPLHELVVVDRAVQVVVIPRGHRDTEDSQQKVCGHT